MQNADWHISTNNNIVDRMRCFAHTHIGPTLCIVYFHRFGRKKMIIGFLALKVASLAVSAFADRFIIFAISRFALGIGNSGVYIGAFILGV